MMTFVFDIDGTLSFDGRTIDPMVVRTLRQLIAAGHQVVFASARPIRDLLPVIPTFQQQPLIGGNGALIRLNGRVEVVQALSSTVSRTIKGLIDQYDLEYVADGAWNYASRVRSDAEILRQVDPAHVAQRVNIRDLSPLVKVILLHLTPEQRVVLRDQLRALPVTIVEHSGEGNLDITDQGVHKAAALAKIGIRDYVAFGNDQNDLSMFKAAAHRVWVTSKPELPVPVGAEPCAANVMALVERLESYC
ncbi:HAD family hydrolase [Lactiplantibacillus carotarum]|uniref:HAD family hydrolase n=1 Tax=Lactiplantibacillus carotarum TaxID=2993456 RepID=UPI00298F1E82|nr:HAD family hydrolase [Lactiplantibacillus carotarum]